MNAMHWIQSELEARGFRTRAYSGRGMPGKQCLGVDINYIGDAFEIMAFLGGIAATDYDGVTVPTPKTDSVGRGMYWPGIKYTQESDQ